MPKLGEIYKSRSLTHDDLKGKRVNLTIKDVEIKKFDDGEKPILHFKESDKTFVLNKTNAKMLAMLTNQDDTDDWAGWKITLRPDMTSFNGRAMECIRIDSELPPQTNAAKARAATATTEEDPDSIPF